MTTRIIRRLSGVVVCISLPVLAATAQIASPLAVPVLSTSGQGEARVTPDRASVMVNIQSRAFSATAAASENASRTRSVLDAMGRLGLSKDQMSTEGYTVYPEMQYDKTGGSPKVSGYVVTNTVRVETRRPEQAGAIVDAALGAGANLITSLSFYASSIDEARRQAIGLAVASARADAEAMAHAAGGAIGGLIELSTGGPTVPPRPMFDMSVRTKSMMQAEPTPVNPGQETVTVFVQARWRFTPTAPGG